MRKYIVMLTALLTPLLLSVSAFAADVGESGSSGGSSGNRLGAQLVPIKDALGDLVDVMEQVYAIMVSNPLFVVLLAATLFALGIRIFRKVKRAAKG